MSNDGQYYSDKISVRMGVEIYYNSCFNFFSFFFNLPVRQSLLVYLNMLICCFSLAVYLAYNTGFDSVAWTSFLFMPNTCFQF